MRPFRTPIIPLLILSLLFAGAAPAADCPPSLILTELQALRTRLREARLYRLGFPEDKSRVDLRKDWRDQGQDHFALFVNLRREAQDYLLHPPLGMTDCEKELALSIVRECVNESLSGQLQMGNEQLLNAGRRKFPSVLSPTTAALVRAPYDEREDWKELALSQLEFDEGIVEALDTIKSVPESALPGGNGTVLRSRGGDETINTPAEGFPTYTIFEQPEFTADPQNKQNFIRTEVNLLMGMLARRGLAATALVDRIRRLAYRANNDVEGRQRHGEQGEKRKEQFNRLAIERAKRDAQLMFYGGLILRTQFPPGGDDAGRDDFKLHNGDKLFAAMSQLNVEFKDIRDGRIPTGIADQFVPSPNKRIGGQQGYLSDAITSVVRAKEAQQLAEQRVREYQQGEVSRVELNRNIREQYLTQLGQLTGFVADGQAGVLKDPEDPNIIYNLRTAQNRKAFLDSLGQKITTAEGLLASDDPLASGSVGKLGSVGLALIERQQATLGFELATERVTQIPKAVQRVEDRLASANGIVKEAAKDRHVWELVEVGAQTVSTFASANASASFDKAWGNTWGWIASAATLTGGVARIKQNDITTIERVDMQTLDAQTQVREILAGKRAAELEAGIQGAQAASADNRIEQLRRQISDLVENLDIYRTDTANLYFLDASLEVEKVDAELQADLDLQDCLATLYDLTKSLEFYWTEKFQNPVMTVEGGIITLPNFANDFTEIDDLYAISDAYDAEKYLNSVGFNISGGSAAGWDSTLRALRQSIPATHQTVVLSLRSDILGFVVPEKGYWDTVHDRPDGDQLVQIHDNGQILPGMENAFAYYDNIAITKFRDVLQDGRRDAFNFAFGTGRDPQDFLPGFEVLFSTNGKSNYFFDAREWNARLESIQLDVRTEGGFIPPGQEESFVRLNLIQEGTVQFRRSFPLELSDAQYDVYQTEFKYQSDRLRISPYEFPVQASVNGSSGPFGGQPALLPYFFSPVCSNWRIVLDPMAHIANNYADINRIKDIRIIMTLRSGIPPTLAEGL